MAIHVLRTAFTSGELDPKLIRPDMEQYQYGASKMRNVFVQPQGGFFRRPAYDFQVALVKHEFARFDLGRTGTTQEITSEGWGISDEDDVIVIQVETRNGVEFYRELLPISEFTVVIGGGPTEFIVIKSSLSSTVNSSETSEFIVVHTSATVPALGTDNVKGFEFNFSQDQKYLVVFLEHTFHIFKDVAGVWTLQATEGTVFTNDVVLKLTRTHQLDSMLLFTHQCPTQHLQRQGSDTDWEIESFEFINRPKRKFSDFEIIPITIPTDYFEPAGAEFGVNHKELMAFFDFTTLDVYTIFADGEETIQVQYDTSANLITNHKVRITSDGTSGFTFWLRLDKDYAETQITGAITRDASDATTASNIQTALRALSHTAAGDIDVTVASTNVFDIEFTGADAGIIWDLFNDFGSSFITELTTTNVGYPVTEQTVLNLTEALMALDVVMGVPRVALTSSTSVSILMGGDGTGDDRQFWTFTSGTTDFTSADNRLVFTTSVKGELRVEDSWSTDGSTPRGYPRCGQFFQGSLFLAGSTDLPQTAWKSRTGNPQDFDNSSLDDDFGFAIDGDTNTVAAFYAMNAGRHLQLFSDEAEYYFPVSTNTTPITPSNATIRRTTTLGSIEGFNLVEEDGVVMFMHRGGTSLREFVFTDTQLAYETFDLSALAPHLLNDPKVIDYQSSLSINNANYLYVVNGDGSMAVLNLLRKENVNAWVLSTTEGLFKDLIVVGDDVLAIFSRTIDGGTSRLFLELQNFASKVDAGASASGVSVTSVSSGLSHLNGEEVDIIVEGTYYGRETLVGGTINFVDILGDPRTVTSWNIGLPFPIVDGGDGQDWVQTLPLALNTQRGSTYGKKIRLMQTDISVINTKSLRIRHDADQTFDAVDQITQMDFVGFLNGDTYQLTVNGENTASITFSTNPATNATNIKNALVALIQFDSSDITVADLAGNSDQMVITFRDDAAGALYVITPSTTTAGTLNLTDQCTGSPAIRPRDNVITFRNLGKGLLGAIDDGFTGDKRIEGILGWSTRGQISFTQNEPLDMNVTNVVMKVRV